MCYGFGVPVILERQAGMSDVMMNKIIIINNLLLFSLIHIIHCCRCIADKDNNNDKTTTNKDVQQTILETINIIRGKKEKKK